MGCIVKGRLKNCPAVFQLYSLGFPIKSPAAGLPCTHNRVCFSLKNPVETQWIKSTRMESATTLIGQSNSFSQTDDV